MLKCMHSIRIPESARAANSTPIHYYNVTCLGYEEKVIDCSLTEGRGEECTHEWDAAVVCKKILTGKDRGFCDYNHSM